jgi:hypothetical protein
LDGKICARRKDADVVMQKPLEVKRRHRAHDPKMIRDSFDHLHAAVAGVRPRNICNINEIGFQIGMGGQRKIITTDTRKVKNHYIASHSDRE